MKIFKKELEKQINLIKEDQESTCKDYIDFKKYVFWTICLEMNERNILKKRIRELESVNQRLKEEIMSQQSIQWHSYNDTHNNFQKIEWKLTRDTLDSKLK